MSKPFGKFKCTGCDEEITVTPSECLTFEVTVCPRCGTDEYIPEELYHKAKRLAEEVTIFHPGNGWEN